MKYLLILCAIACYSCQPAAKELKNQTQVELIVLGTEQDAGAPHMGCEKACCTTLYEQGLQRKVISLAIVDHQNNQTYLVEATPDISIQLKDLKTHFRQDHAELPDGIFITHAHIGHYTGLMYLGKEAKGADKVPVYAMPRLNTFLELNGPWSQLVRDKNIELRSLEDRKLLKINNNISIMPLVVPHRDEYSETVGFVIHGPHKQLLFIPDIDKWGKWEEDIRKLVPLMDFVFIDGTFYSGDELDGRDMSLIPHPSIEESMLLLDSLSSADKAKIHFVHFNHTNPVNNPRSAASKQVLNSGYQIIREGQVFGL